MLVSDIKARVKAKCDDRKGTYITSDYIDAFLEDAYEWLYNRMKESGSEFDGVVLQIPALPAGTPDLDALMATGQPLATLVNPRMIRWRLPGQNDTYFSRADGPLAYVRDMPDPGIPSLDSWAWRHYSIKLSKFSTPLDLEISGDFLYDPLVGDDASIKIANNANRALASKIASDIGKARGNPNWKVDYAADADEAVDGINMILVKAQQAETHRVGRMTRRANVNTRSVNNF